MRRKSLNSVEVRFFKLDYDDILRHLRCYASKLLDKGVKLVILIGSLARGDFTAFSDADLIIICDDVPSRFLDRIDLFLDPSLPIDLDLRVYTSSEFLGMAREGRRFISELLRYGIVLAGNQKFLDLIKENYASFAKY